MNGKMMPLTGFSLTVTFKADNYAKKKKENSVEENTSLSQNENENSINNMALENLVLSTTSYER